MNKQKLLRSVAPFSRLSDDQLDLLAARLGNATFKRGETIFHQGSPGSVLYIIANGQVRIYTTGETGQELSVTIFRAGDFFGELALLDNQPRSASAEAMVATRTLTLHRADFLPIVTEHPAIAIAILETLAARLRSSNTYAGHLANYTAPQRVVHQLLNLASRYGITNGGATSIELNLTQDDLASLSGTTRETVNRVLANLRDQGLIQVERARVRILDLGQLQHALPEY